MVALKSSAILFSKKQFVLASSIFAIAKNLVVCKS